MAETTSEEEREMQVTNPDGSVSTVTGRIVTTDHGITDEDGNPKISVNINVPMATGRTPEEIEADRLRELHKEGV